MKDPRLLCWLAAAVASIAVATPASSQWTNGSFEIGIDPGSFSNLPPGSTAITGWTVVVDDIDYIGSAWVSSDGARSLDLDGSSGSPFPSGGIAQTFATIVGAAYQVTFDMAGNPGSGPTIKPMRVSAAGQSADFFFDITGKTLTDMGWEKRSWQFTATDVSTTLQFRSLTADMALPTGWGPAVDNVAVAVVPAPVPALGRWGVHALTGLLVVMVLIGRHHRRPPRRPRVPRP